MKVKQRSLKYVRISTLLFYLLQFTSNGFSQVSYGVKTGYNISKTTGNLPSRNELSYKTISGFQFGGILNLKVTKTLSVQPELLYSCKGWNEEIIIADLVNNSSLNRDIKLNYIEVPILIKYGYGDKIKLFINAGPYFAYTFNGSHKSEVSTTINETSITTTTKGKIKHQAKPDNYIGYDLYYEPSKFNQFDIGLSCGCGIGKKLWLGTLIIDIRYGLGLINFQSDKYFENVNNQVQIPEGYKEFKNRTFSISLIYEFSKKHAKTN